MADQKDLLLIKTHSVVPIHWVPMGLMYVAKAAEERGAKVKIIDLSLERNYKEVLESNLIEYKPRLVGIGGMCVEFDGVKETAGIVKKIMPDVKVIAGGPLAIPLFKECLRDNNVDIVVFQEGESAIQDLLRNINKEMALSQIKGIAFRNDGDIFRTESRPIEDIDAIPIPAWHLIDPLRYIESRDNWFGIEHLKAMNIVPARGCPYSCIFCDKSVFGQKWRGRNPKNIIDEMILLKDTYGAEAIQFLDDIIDVNKKWVTDFICEIKSHNLKMYWGCASRVNHADYELYKKMHDAGCLYVYFGIEFGSDVTLQKAKKQATVEQAYKAIEIARKAGLKVVSGCMLGMLDETDKQINETIRFAMSSKSNAVGISVLTPIGGTVLFDMAVVAGKIDPNQPWWRATRANAQINLSKDVSNKRLAYLASKAYWMLFWSRPSRKWPKFVCQIMQFSFYILSPFTGDRFVKIVFWFDNIRKKLHLGLP